MKKEINFTKVYKSLYDGEYKIIEDLGTNNKGYHMVKIYFMQTKNVQEAIFYRAERGQVRDKNKRVPDFNKIYESNNFGPFKFINTFTDRNFNHTKCTIKFIETGTVVKVSLHDALAGRVRDNYRPYVCGVACIGNASSKCREYSLWLHMIRRCYSTNFKEYAQYGGKGITVCNRWLCFENFLNDVKYLSGYNLWVKYPGEYEIDKDYLQMNVPEDQKYYSPHTCCFIKKLDNIKYAAKYQKCNNANKYTSKYIGVSKDANKPSYRSHIVFNNIKRNLGSYESELAAANVYNNISKMYYGEDAIINNCPYLSPEDIARMRRPITEMCKIIDE